MSENSHDTTGHSGKRTDCHLCLKPNAKMKHLHQLQSQFKETYAWLNEHKAELDNAACLCLPCVKQIQRNHHREFTPRWLAKPPVPPKLCNVQHCQGTVHAQTSLMSAAALETCLKAKVNDQSTGKMETAKWKAEWEVPQNIATSKSSIDFFLSGCKCKTGCSTRICSCKKKERKCGPSCSCHFCKNTSLSQRETRETCANETDLVVNDLLEENCEDT